LDQKFSVEGFKGYGPQQRKVNLFQTHGEVLIGFKGILHDYLLCLFAITQEPREETFPYFDEEKNANESDTSSSETDSDFE
jgi:hypothetical protein